MKTALFIFFAATIFVGNRVQAQQKKSFVLPEGVTASDYAPGQVWVKVNEKNRHIFEDQNSAARTSAKFGAVTVNPLVNATTRARNNGRVSPANRHVDIGLYYQVTFDKTKSLVEFANELYTTGYFEIIEPVYNETPLLVPNDPNIGSQYYLDIINAYEAWDITQGDESIVIGVVDTGGDLDHPDLQNKLFINENDPVDGIDNDDDGYIDNYRGWDFSGAVSSEVNTPGFVGDNDPSIPKGNLFGHGTRVGGIAAAEVNNSQGIAGVGFKSKLLFTKHYSDDQAASSTVYSSNLYLGVLYAATHGAKIINCSWGGTSRSTINQDIITYVTLDLGCLVVAAAGNSNNAVPIYPASYEYVISVAASDGSDTRYAFSSFGRNVDITAPGLSIYSTMYDNTFAYQSGTSLSAPMVSGAAALLWAQHPEYTALQVGEQLRATADENLYVVNPSFNHQLGKGRLDILKALTTETPSVRVSNIRFEKATGGLPDAGEEGMLYADFTNYLKPTSAALTVTASTTSPYITITQNTFVAGAIQTLGVVRNTSNPFRITVADGAPLNIEIEVLLTFTDTDYTDYQTLLLEFPAYIDVTENSISTSITSIGRIGFADTQGQRNGLGFIYEDHSLLYEMGLIMGTSTSDLYNNLRSTPGSYDQDFTADKKMVKQTPGERSYSEVSGGFRNTLAAGSETLRVDYKSLVWKKEDDSPYNNFVILEYTITNTAATDAIGFYFGLFADWDVASGGGADRAAWDSETRTGYVFQAQGNDLPYVGMQSLTGTPHYLAIDNDQTISGNPFGLYDGFTDAEKFTTVSGGVNKTQAGNPTTGNDVSNAISSGPYTIPAGQQITIAFALHAAPNLDDLLLSAHYADTVYNFTFKAPQPLADAVEICLGEQATLTATGADEFLWYANNTGGDAIASGDELIVDGVTSDSVFFVSNADEHYESIRTAVAVTVNPLPVAAFSYTGDLLSGATIAFTDESIGATSWHWIFGDDAESTEQNPEHLYTPGGNYTVTLVVESDAGCSDAEEEPLVIITGIENGSNGFAKIYPNPVRDNVLMIETADANHQRLEVVVTDMRGRRMSRKIAMYTEDDVLHLDVSNLPSGLYVVEIRDQRRSMTRKIVVAPR